MSKVSVFPIQAHGGAKKMTQHVDFPTLDHFVEDIETAGIDEVRIDMFESVRATELSFVYYVSLVLVLTAADSQEGLIYEYSEVEETVTATEPHVTDELVRQRAQDRMSEVTRALRSTGLQVRHGRFTCDG